ncbi:MAG: esterase [Weeksellaceae bacterium]|nr:esterase [Weeksellaceae bacterium]
MKILKIITAAFILCFPSMQAQESLGTSSKKGLVSPDVNGTTVTFRLKAPEAKSVKLMGSWLPAKNWDPTTLDLQQKQDGIWEITQANLPPDLYTYSFLVDGVKVDDPNNVYLVRDIANIMNMVYIDGPKSANYKVQNVPHGTVSKRWYPSKGTKADRRITIYTPAGYENSKEKFPVLYLLHGLGGDEESWMTLGRASQILDNLIAQGKAKPMIVVMTNGHTSTTAAPGESAKGFYKPTMMAPDALNAEMETYFREIIDFTENNYRAKKDVNSRAIAGLSMGGFHSLYISANYPKTFAYVGLFSPAVMPPRNALSEIYKNIDDKLKTQSNNQYQLYWIGIGKDDFLYKNVADFRQKLDALHFKYQYVESTGGHTWINWRTYLTEFLPLLFN